MDRNKSSRCAYSGCRKVLRRNSAEGYTEFQRRKHCDRQCYALSRGKGIEGRDRLGVRIKCKCPKCGKIYSACVYWTGNGMPRRFCNACKNSIAYAGYRSTYDMVTIHNTETRARLRKMFDEWDECLEQEQITHYSEQNYSQEQLRALVPSEQENNV